CKEEEANASDESRCRKTVLLINTGELHYKVAAESTTIFECSDCGGAGVGDPMQGVVFDNDTVKFFSFYGAATKTMETTAFVYDTISKKWKQTLFTSEWYNIFDTLPGSEIKQNIEIKTAKDFGDIYFGSD
ncbi:MAG: hypothetical protein KDD49_13425, partial [Bacteroidetes bacterium]|nr:hypothetical protein [Bacteroidota bacterium]